MATGPFGSSISAKFFQESGIPVIRGSNLSADVQIKIDDSGLVFVSKDKAKEFPRCIVSNGDLVFTCWGTINQVGLIDDTATYQKYLISNKQMKLTVDRTKADPRFVYYVFSGPTKQSEIIENGIGSSVPGFNLGQLRKHSFRLPPLEEQQAIADLLDIFSNRIALLRETNATLEAIAQALFKSWFVDFDPVHARARGEMPAGLAPDVAALFPDSLEESELGRVPKGWRIGMLSDLCSISSGKRPPERSDDLTVECNIPLYGGAGLMGYTSASLFDSPRIVTGRVGTLGKVHVAYPPFWASDNVLVLTPIDNSMFAFSLHWMRSIDVHALNRGSTQPLLTQKDLGAQLGVIPSPEVFAEFEATVSMLYEQIRDQGEQAKTLATLRDALLPRLISGQLRLPEAEAMVLEAQE